MKRLIVFKSLILATLFLSPVLISCSDDDTNTIETNILYSQLPAKFSLVKTWFADNETIAPSPNASTGVEIEEGDQFENDHAIGNHYYEIDIDDYFSDGTEYDIEFYLNESLEIIAVTVNDVKVTSTSGSAYTVAEAQLRSDYKDYTIGKIAWSTERDYQIGTFDIITKTQAQTITAWYKVSGETATREMDSKYLGITVPEKIRLAFEATKYSDANIWRIEEIELEHNYNSNGNGIEIYYEVELENIQNPNLEAELFFSDETGKLLYSKEELDDDDDDRDDDKFVVNAQLKAAVEAAAPGAQIIEAEIDDNLIEVEAIITIDGIMREIELEFTMDDYTLVSSETETKYTYGTLPAEFDVVKAWFKANPTTPPPTANTEVEITKGKQNEDDYTIGDYYYEVEIDDYISGIKYDVEFYLGENREIIAVIVNDMKQTKL